MRNIKKVFGFGLAVTGVITGGLMIEMESAEAFVVKNGWKYEIDIDNDSTSSSGVDLDGSGP